MSRAGGDTGRGTAWVLAQAPLLLLAFGLPALTKATFLPWPAGTSPGRELAGALVAVLGALLLTLGALRLGRNLTPFPRPKAAGILVTTGLYALVRHPMYGGIILLAFAGDLRAGSWIAAPTSLLVFLFFDRKAGLEERWLAERFAGYAAYRRRTAKLIPWVY